MSPETTQILQKRKLEAPFYYSIHQWLLGARHRQACRLHEKELLELQDALYQGQISLETMQTKVKSLVEGHFSSKRESVKFPIKAKWWYCCSSSPWVCFAGTFGNQAEILFQRMGTGKGLMLTFRYEICLESDLNTPIFVFNLLKRFNEGNTGIANKTPVLGAQHLTSVSLTYSPLDMTVKKRWNEIERLLKEQESKEEMFLRGICKLQCKFRHLRMPVATEDYLKVSNARKSRKKKKVVKNTDKSKQNTETNTKIALASDQSSTNDCTDEHSIDMKDDVSGPNSSLPIDTPQKKAQQPTITTNLPPATSTTRPIEDTDLAFLSSEIRDLVAHIDKTMTKKWKNIDELMSLMEACFHEHLPCASLHLFGSHASGFALPSSDIDLFYKHREDVCFGCIPHDSACFLLETSVTSQLEYIQNVFYQQPWVQKVTLIRSATMPILRINACLLVLNGEAEDTHLTSTNHLCPMCCVVDLSCGHTPGHSNMMASSLLKKESSRYPHLRPLMLVLKQIMVERNLCNVFEGGISSFSLALLLLRYLQHVSTHPLQTHPVAHKQPSLSSSETSNSAYQRQLADWPNTVNHRPSYTLVQGLNPYINNGQQHVVTDLELEAYHRQLADWPSMDAAHHFIWMQTIRRMPPPSPRTAKPLEEDNSLSSSDTIGAELLGFLNFYGNEFDPMHVGITVIGDGAYYELPASKFTSSPQPLVIDNPCWPNLNVACASYKMPVILKEFKSLHATLLETMLKDRGSENDASFLRRIVKAKWGLQDRKLLREALLKQNKQS